MILILGKFESFHIGHQKLIDIGKSLSKNLNLPVKLISFSPLPYEIFYKDYIPIYTKEEREHIAKNKFLIDIDFLDFKEIKDLNAVEFLKFLKKQYNFKFIIVGEDFSFGKNKKGSFQELKNYESILHYKSIKVNLEMYNNEKVATSTIRRFLIEGKIEIANKFLNHLYFTFGKVIFGKQIGKKLGFPTANISCKKLILKYGVYKGYLYIKEENRSFLAIANYGKRPTLDGEKVVLEAHIPHAKLNIYNKNVIFWFEKFIRPEKRFSSIKELKEQIKKDIEEVLKDAEIN